MEQALGRELALFYPATLDKQGGGFMHALPEQWAKMSAKARQKNCVSTSRG